MVVTKLHIERFRNYKAATVDFCDNVNVITGRNAQGKSNLIEAIYYLSCGKAFRTATDKELITFDNSDALICAEIISADRCQTLEARLFNGRRRQLLANGIKLKNAGELSGKLTTVVFCPDDLCLIKEGASIRRKLMDNALSQMRPKYAKVLQDANKLYEHKTRILRDHFEKPSLLDLLDDFNLRLAEQNSQLIYYRSAFANLLSARALDIHNEFTSGQETLSIKYKTVGGIDTVGKSSKELLPFLMEHQKSHREAEIRSGYCLSGAHKDDLEIEINSRAARKYASQGQTRTASVSIKLAERDMYFEDSGEYPVLLLDDVLSELDLKRREFILGKIQQGQVFITCCDDESPLIIPYGKLLKIENGEIIDNVR